MSKRPLYFRCKSLTTGVLCALLTTACTFRANVSPAAEHVKIAYLPIVHSLPLYLALEKGYFAEEGLEVEPIKFDSPNQIIDALLSGQVGIGAPGTAAGITAVSQDKKPGSLKIFAVSGEESATAGTRNDAFLVRSDSIIASVEGLRGKRIGVLPGIQWRTITRHILTQHAISFEDVTLVELAVPLQAQALASGQVDALLALEPVPTVVVSKGIGRVLLESPTLTDIADPFYPGCGDVSTSFLEEHPETVRKVLKVFARASDEIMSDPDAARQYLRGYTALDDALIAKVPMLTWKMHDAMTPKDIAGLQAFFDIFAEHGVIGTRVDAFQLLLPSPDDDR